MTRILACIAILLFLLMIISSSAIAQQIDYGVKALSGPPGILLSIGPDVLHSSTADKTDGWVGYNIYRRAEREDRFTRINAAPLSRVSSLTELEEKLGTAIQLWINMLKLREAEELWRIVESNDPKILTFSLFDHSMREALGLLYWDSDVKKGSNYTYVITRVNSQGVESPRSLQSSATFGVPRYVLRGPLGVTGKAGNNKVNLQWQPNPADTSVFSYIIYRSVDPTKSFRRLNDRPVVIFSQTEAEKIPKGAFIDTTARNDRIYYYTVVSVDYAGNESPKQQVLAFRPKDMTPPSAPQGLKADASGLGITLRWRKNPEEDVIGYNIFRSDNPDSNFTRMNEELVPVDTGYYEDSSVIPNKQYFYRITAIDKSGNESEHSANGFTVFKNFRPPLPPQSVDAEGRSDGVLIQWEENSEADLRGYYVFRAERLNGELVQVSPLIPGDTTFYVDNDPHISAKGSYWYLVQAVNYTGAISSFSAPVVASPLIRVKPDPPLSFYGYQDVMGNRLFWTPPEDNTVEGYNVYRVIESDSRDFERITSEPVPWNIRTFTDTTAAFGVTYIYQIRLINYRKLEGEPSHNIKLSKFEPPPKPPGNIRVSETQTGSIISWDITLRPRVSGYHVYRRAGKDIATRLTEMILPKETSQFRDDNIERDVRYFYSVSCVGDDGREGQRSAEIMFLIPR